jgi:hypothetical protein
MEQDKPLDPTDLCRLRPHTVMPHPDGLLDLTEQPRLVPYESVRYA